MRSGSADRASSHRQPKVGITTRASNTSNIAPIAQNICNEQAKSVTVRQDW
ncbi:hypothetical protein DPMN_006575 [Dreissena polymorpha]|uniref:Uncharacterized protein n=1 Tax=Dreissena polymorpha TaxID=45954 RepID=A0A9D4RV27_DREPO|nr:hypothetical protein DPMN_006575 [Dreissena polymorpha]